jgi:hypothetical protein
MHFSGWFNWTEVNDTNNQFVFTNLNSNAPTTITLNEGNYSLQKLGRIISALYPAVECRHVPEFNKFVFTFDQPHSITFVENSFEILGFKQTDDGIQGTTITSTPPIKPMKRLNVYVRLMDTVPCDDCMNLENF